MKTKKTWRIILILGIALALAAAGFYFYKNQLSSAQAPEEPALQTATVRRGDLVISATGAGTVIPAADASLGFANGGLLVELPVQVGSKVNAGGVLARVDDKDAASAVEQAQLSLDQAQLQVDHLKEAPTPAELASAQAALASAQATLQSRQKPGSNPEIAAARQSLASVQAKLDELLAGPSNEAMTTAAMQLTVGDIGEVLQAQGSGSFGGGFEGRNAATTGGGNARGGGFAGPPLGGFPGGGPGGVPGGGPGGVPGGGFANASPEQRATAIADRKAQDGGQAATFMTRGLLNQLITSLRIKTGDLTEAEVQAQPQQRAIMRWLPVVSETTGIAVEDLNTAITGGASLAEVIKDKGGDVTAVETALREALKSNPNLDEQAIKDQIVSVLNTKVTPQ